jgi:hypothetical protein
MFMEGPYEILFRLFFGLALLIAFDRLASVESSISNVVDVLFRGRFGGLHPQAKALSL